MRPAKLGSLVAASIILASSYNAALAQKKYDSGASDTEIKIGNTLAYSGPGSAYSVIARTQAAYFKKINDEGGINGRKINYISYDDATSPPKTLEQTRKLVESDEVLLMFNPLGTPNNAATQKYLNLKKVPQLFVGTAATRFGADPKEFPWTMGWAPSYVSEGRVYARFILATKPDGKIAVLSQNDDYGKDMVKGLKEGLGDKAKTMIVGEEAYEVTEPTMDSRIVKLKASGADVFVNFSTSKFAAQAIKKAAELGWKPLHVMNNVSSSIGATFVPAGLENSVGIISSAYLKDTGDVSWKDDAGLKEMNDFLAGYYPEVDRNSIFMPYAYTLAQVMTHVLKQSGDNLTRENVMKQAASMKDLTFPMLLPGVKVNTGPDDFFPVQQLQLIKFNGTSWERFGDVVDGK